MEETRFIGCLLGCAVGDALGQPIEAFPPERLRRDFGEIRDFMPGDTRFALPLGAGQWTDDTQLTLDLARSIVRCGKVDPEDIAREFLADHETAGIRFSGFTIKYSLMRLKRGLPWDQSAIEDEEAQGNGSAMRVAPVGLFDCRHPDRLPEDARLAGIITHRHPETIAGSLAVASLVARAAGTLNLATAIDDTIALIGPCRVADNLRLAQRLLATDISTADALVEIGTTGWVVHTVAAAAYCFLKTPTDFERSIIDAVMGGYDADTTAAITGAISGAYNGEASIPLRWRTDVESADEIRALAQALWKLQSD
ncbi:MAG: ADP-ribosylation/Crystallin [Chthonomonadales bacterium]|nr:ADP-ribosylation/Crystallin [Chthonomonadales bacterium]